MRSADVVAVALVGAVALLGAGCPPSTTCGEVEFALDSGVCDGPCVVDFGAVAFGLSETRRLSWRGTGCDGGILDPPTIVDDDREVFALGESRFELGANFDEGFVFVSARPPDDDAHEASLQFDRNFDGDGDDDGDIDFDLIVNR